MPTIPDLLPMRRIQQSIISPEMPEPNFRAALDSDPVSDNIPVTIAMVMPVMIEVSATVIFFNSKNEVPPL